MREFRDAGPASPVADIGMHGTFGMSLRDYFAAKAMALIDARNEISVGEVRKAIGLDADADYQWQTHWPMYLAQQSYALADAMIAARSQP